MHVYVLQQRKPAVSAWGDDCSVMVRPEHTVDAHNFAIGLCATQTSAVSFIFGLTSNFATLACHALQRENDNVKVTLPRAHRQWNLPACFPHNEASNSGSPMTRIAGVFVKKPVPKHHRPAVLTLCWRVCGSYEPLVQPTGPEQLSQ